MRGPGRKPYECARRAWHSERHQPMRGSLIQEIFRVVNEIHSSATKKNKEWQEKLPIVVLKAEEIMYSKANSETEYMDLKTLWDRANDAIDTIIRRDENTETGDSLQPCIEAALNLGCTARRESRSQQINNPRCYLSSNTREPTCVHPNNLEKIIEGNRGTNLLFVSHDSNFIKPSYSNLTLLGSESHSSIPPKSNYRTANKLSILSRNIPPLETCAYALSSSFSVYPLYYGNQLQSQVSQFSSRAPPYLISHCAERAETDTQKLFPCDIDRSNKIPEADLGETLEDPPGIGCDLSLRLGPLSAPCISIENSWPQEVEDDCSSTSREGIKLSGLNSHTDKEFSFFPNTGGNDPLDSCSRKCSTEAENLNVEMTMRKRKPIHQQSEDRQFCWQQPKFRCNRLAGKLSNAGL